MSVDVRVILLVKDDRTTYIPIELETLGVFMCMYMMIIGISTKRWLSHYQNSMSLSALGSILKNFWGTDVGRCEGHTLGWRRQDYIHPT
jgi:hypothetical protein